VRVTSAQIDLSAQHALTQNHTRREELAIVVQDNDGTTTQSLSSRERTQSSAAFEQPSLLDAELAGLDAAGQGLSTALVQRATEAGQKLPSPEELKSTLSDALQGFGLDLGGLGMMGAQPFDTQLQPKDRFKMELIQAAVEAFSGGEFSILDPADLDLAAFAEPVSAEVPPKATDAPKEDDPAAEAGQDSERRAGLIYSYQDRHYERETTSFAASGVVHTADGEQIDFDVELTMGRQFLSETSGEVRLGADVQDPLVVNFEGTAAELTERTYSFDLDTDGTADQIHFVSPNSGFLAHDANNNGIVDDGSELFGPTTGSGFGELAVHDEDGNDFIDEGDSIYGSLRIWQKDAEGNDHLIALGQAGVGAIYLNSVATPFQVKDDENQLQGIVRSSGIYLKEEGGAGTVQQLDLVV
jgi:hypothetical protein|tara:strand:- start:472 stop:1710 length:1239 start_codon:yes stop_codon:yes gene_type:complete